MPNDDQDTETERHTTGDIFDALVELNASVDGVGHRDTDEVANFVGCSNLFASLKLNQLAEDGKVNKTETGSGWLWILADDTAEADPLNGLDTTELTNDEQMLLIRYIAAKALVESDRIDIAAVPYDTIENALWAAAGDAQHGLHLNDPVTFTEFTGYHADTETNTNTDSDTDPDDSSPHGV